AEVPQKEIEKRVGHAHRLPCVESSYHDQDRGQDQKQSCPEAGQDSIFRQAEDALRMIMRLLLVGTYPCRTYWMPQRPDGSGIDEEE
ncbi:MAG: hypothetical protein R6W92_00800, partial [Desulfocurvibacter africanus]